MEVSVQLHTLATLPLKKKKKCPQCPLNRELGKRKVSASFGIEQ
jgi:hypothetical protein